MQLSKGKPATPTRRQGAISVSLREFFPSPVGCAALLPLTLPPEDSETLRRLTALRQQPTDTVSGAL
jgi:hypothetical protein